MYSCLKARSLLVVQCREMKKTEDFENVFFKALTNRFWLTSKNCPRFSKVVCGRPSIKWTSRKGNDTLLKVDKMYRLLKKSTWKWSLINR